MKEGNWYAVITADVLYDNTINARQKLLVAVVSNLSNTKGYCFASNSHLSKMMNVSVSTIQRDLSVLEGKYLGRVVKLKDNGEVDYRALTPINNYHPTSLVTPPHSTSDMTPHSTGAMYNNKVNNNKYNNGETQKLKIDDDVLNFYSDYCKESGHTQTTANRVKTEKQFFSLSDDERELAVSKYKEFIAYRKSKQMSDFGDTDSKYIPRAFTYVQDRLWEEIPKRRYLTQEPLDDGTFRYRFEDDGKPAYGYERFLDHELKKFYTI